VGYELSIFNCWGELLFITKDLREQWNGTHKGRPVPMEIYIWQASFSFQDGVTGQLIAFKEAGDLTLIR
jgi:gliding motility-associated-like protein